MVDRGVVLGAPGEVALEEIRVDDPGPGEVLVRIDATGVCHSDLHVIQEDGWGHTLPVLLGHEGAGTVERSARTSRVSPKAIASCSDGIPHAATAHPARVAFRASARGRRLRRGGCIARTVPS